MKRISVVVEGQTEEEFIKRVVRPHLRSFDLEIVPELLITKERPQYKGGFSDFRQLERDIQRQCEATHPRADMITMMIDFYGLKGKKGFANFQAPETVKSHEERVAYLSQGLARHFADPRFVPYFSTHEIEALFICFSKEIAGAIQFNGSIPVLAPTQTSPESINLNDPPAKRIERAFPRFSKRLHGPIVAKRVGIVAIRSHCPLFNTWIAKMEELGTSRGG